MYNWIYLVSFFGRHVSGKFLSYICMHLFCIAGYNINWSRFCFCFLVWPCKKVRSSFHFVYLLVQLLLWPSACLYSLTLNFQVIYVFGFGVPLFVDGVGTTNKLKWSLWIIHKLLLTAVYGFILFVHFSKWRARLPREYIADSVIIIFLQDLILFNMHFSLLSSAARPGFYNYIVIMFVINAVALFACGLAGLGAGFGIWYL